MNWRLFIYFSVPVVVLFSCGTRSVTVKDYIKNADSASIAFYEPNDTATQIIIRDKKSIEKLGSYIDGKTITPLKCSDSGSIWFYETGKKKMQVDFSINGDCNSFSYMMNDKIYSKSMSADANKYLISVKTIASGNL